MDTMQRLAHTLVAGCCLVAAVSLSACGGPEPAQAGHSPAGSQQDSAPSASAFAEHPDPLTQAAPASSPTSPACAAGAENPLAGVRQLPLVVHDQITATLLNVAVVEDHYDPCRSLSWSVIAGDSGNGNSMRQGVVFFIDGVAVNDPRPMLQERIESVEAIGQHSALVTYAVAVGPRAAGEITPGTATFAVWGDKQLAVVDNNLPVEANQAGAQVDLAGNIEVLSSP